jgi:polyhydroxyalkanoate synthesis regulator phasin
MSYQQLRTVAADIKARNPPQVRPNEFNIGAALVALADGLESDFRSLRDEIASLRQQVKDLEESKR